LAEAAAGVDKEAAAGVDQEAATGVDEAATGVDQAVHSELAVMVTVLETTTVFELVVVEATGVAHSDQVCPSLAG
jgi:hypothetical protein